MEGERHPSLWMETTPSTAYPQLKGQASADVAVIGGGMAGLQTTLLLKRAGMTVVLLESRALGSGVSGFTTAKITALHGVAYAPLRSSLGAERAALYADANQTALKAMVTVIDDEGIACDLREDVAVTYAESAEERRQIEEEAEAARQAGLPVEFADDLPLPFPTLGGVTLAGQARFHPRRYLLALAERVNGEGSAIYERSPVVELDDQAMTVRTAEGSVAAGAVVIATHAPIFDHGPLLARAMPRRSYALAVRLPNGQLERGMYISAGQDYHSIRPHDGQDGSFLILGGQPHRTGEGGDTVQRYAALERWSREHFAFDTVDYRWSTHDQFTLDRVPFIGRFRPGQDKVLVATGFKGWGMTHSMVAAIMLRDRLLGRSNPWSELYDPWRGNIKASAGPFMRQAADTVKHLVGDKVVKRKNPSCTHMGCTLQPNEAEESWDCPCHGSRFSMRGAVLVAPAIKPLKLE
jgi:glycine/D-amino acid oxidase-like deaminating enzyme